MVNSDSEDIIDSVKSDRSLLFLPSSYFTFDPGLTVNFIFTLREPNVYKPHGFFFGLPRHFHLL